MKVNPVEPHFKDKQTRLYEFTDLFLVHCPRCKECAKVVIIEAEDPPRNAPYAARLQAPRRLVCVHCGYVRERREEGFADTQTVDWYFHQPLWLVISCCGETLWAYNGRHLDFLEEFVRAGIREAYPNGTLASRIPAWMKSARNREDVLKCIEKLRKRLPENS